MQRGVCGAANLNQVLQAAMNPSEIFLRRGGTPYRLRDKVMQIRNDYDKEVFNYDLWNVSVKEYKSMRWHCEIGRIRLWRRKQEYV